MPVPSYCTQELTSGNHHFIVKPVVAPSPLGPSPHQPFKLTPHFFYIELHGSRGASPAGKVASGTKLSRLKGVL